MVQVVPVEKSYKVFTYRIYRQFTQQSTWYGALGQIPPKCKETSNLMLSSMIQFILVLVFCCYLFCIANLRIRFVTETENVSSLFYKKLNSSFSLWLTHLTPRFLYLLGCSGPWCGGGLATCGSATGGLATCDGGAAAVCGAAENLMRCLHACRSIKPHVRSCWEMNYSTFPFGDFCLCSLFFSAACSTGHGSLSLIYSCSIREPSQITFAFFGIWPHTYPP